MWCWAPSDCTAVQSADQLSNYWVLSTTSFTWHWCIYINVRDMMCVWCIYIYTYTHSCHITQCSVIGFDLQRCHRCDRCTNTGCGMQRMWCWGWLYVGRVSLLPSRRTRYACMHVCVRLYTCMCVKGWVEGRGWSWKYEVLMSNFEGSLATTFDILTGLLIIASWHLPPRDGSKSLCLRQELRTWDSA